MEKKWWHNAVVYQIYSRSFKDSNGDGIGDIRGIIEKIPYLLELGIDVIWLCPIYESPNKDNGYDISDYYNIMQESGTMEDFEELLKISHENEIKIIMDLVVSHVSDQHKWFVEAKDNKNSPYRNYFVWATGLQNDLKSIFSGSAWEEYPKDSKNYYLHLFTKEQPDLNWKCTELREAIYKMMNFWLDKGIDGFRMDVIDLIGKEPEKMITENGPKLHQYIQEMNLATFGDRDALTVGETWGATPENGKLFSSEKRDELSMIFQFEHLSVDQVKGKERWDLKSVDFKELKNVLTKWQVTFENEGWNSLFWNNHDTPRIISRWGNDKQYRNESAKMFAILLHMMKGTPYIYQGEEIGMTNILVDNIEIVNDIQSKNLYYERIEQGYSHEELMTAINTKGRDNARTPMQWNATENGGFSTTTPWLAANPNYKKINVAASLDDEESILSMYQKLIKIRHNHEIVVYGKFKDIPVKVDTIYCYTRTYKKEKWLIVCNMSEKHETVDLTNFIPKQLILSNYKKQYSSLNEIKLSPFEAFVIEVY